MTSYYEGKDITADDVRAAVKKDRVFRLTIDENGQVSDLWVKLKLSDCLNIDRVSFYRPHSESLAIDPWTEGSRTVIEEGFTDNFWYIANGDWTCRMDPDGDNFKLWGFRHEQYHGNLVKEGCRYIEINQSLLASKLGVPREDLDDVTYLYREVDAGKLQEVVNDYKQRKYIFV